MTEQEAMEVLKQPCLCDYDLSNTVLDCDIKQCDKRDAVLQAIKALEEICQYREIGTPEECREEVEKQRARKISSAWCPCCGNYLTSQKLEDEYYCVYCGQKLDWSDEE